MIDILLVIKIRTDLKSKKEFAIKNYNNNNNNNNSSSSTNILKEKFEKKLDEIAKAEMNTNKMIIYSLIFVHFLSFARTLFIFVSNYC
mgnify:CR=1 FL=1